MIPSKEMTMSVIKANATSQSYIIASPQDKIQTLDVWWLIREAEAGWVWRKKLINFLEEMQKDFASNEELDRLDSVSQIIHEHNVQLKGFR